MSRFAPSVRWVRFLAVGLVVFILATPTFAAVGRTSGVLNVSPTGAAAYSIPLWTPPGVNGMQPSLGLTYNSQAGNGLLGVGWSLSGFSTITRCNRTYAQDGGGGSPQLDNSDRFCLDGQRLRTISGAYGASGSTYQTEVSNFSLVTSYGTAGSGPAWFEVKGKNGWIYEYGHTSDSAIVSAGVSSIRVWALSSVRDRSGNEMRLTYTNDTSNGSYRPASIHFTYTTVNPSPSYQVTFSYQSRPSADVLWSYTLGGRNNELNYLNQIDVSHWNGSTWALQRRYTLTYGTGGASSRLRVSSIQECSASDCLPALTIGYQDGSSGWGSELASSGNMTNMADALPLDVNGDGIHDLVYPDPSGTWYYSLGTTSGTYQGPYSTGIPSTNYGAAVPIDYNSDGNQDILVPNTSGFWRVMFFQSTGGAFTYTDTSTPATSANGGWVTAADLDGDGREDLVYLYEASTGWGAARYIHYRTNTGSGFSTTQNTLYTVQTGGTQGPFARWGSLGPLGHNASRFVGKNRRLDFNNDGRADLLVYFAHCSADLPGQCTSGAISYTWRIILSTATGSFLGMDAVGVGYGSSSLYPPLAADYNGDGCTDLAYPTSGTWRMRPGTCWRAGATFSLDAEVNTGSTYYGSLGYAMDWDGDGRDDIVSPNGSGTLGYARSTGATLNGWASLGITPAATMIFVADANGDGLSDLVYSASNALRSRVHNGVTPDLATSFTDGYGLTTSASYVHLTQSNYTKGSGRFYPGQDYQGPLAVVTSVAGPNGIGGTFTQSFWYYEASVNLHGRGFEGFEAIRMHDSRDNLYRKTFYRLWFPVRGQVHRADLYQSDGTTLITRAEDDWDYRTLDYTQYNQRYLAFIFASERHEYEVGGPWNGALIRSTFVENYDVDDYGTILDQTVAVQEGSTGLNPNAGWHYQYATVTSVTNDIANWCLGKPSQVEYASAHSLAGGAEIVRTQSYTWDTANCRLTQTTIEPGNSQWQVATNYGYDSFGNVNAVTLTPASGQGQAARTTGIYWGTTGYFPLTLTNPKSQVTTLGWDTSKGFRTSLTDPNNLQTSWQYDDFGRKTREQRPDGTATDFTLAWCNTAACQGSNTNLRSYVLTVDRDTSNAEITRAYLYGDMFDRQALTQERVVTGAYSTVQTVFDARGLVHQRSMPYLGASPSWYTTYSYDTIGRPTLIRRPTSDTDSSNHDTQFSYQGLTLVVTDALNHSTTYKYDAFGQIIQTIDASNNDIDYEYDAFGNLIRTRNASGQEIALTYNVRGMKMSSSDPDMGSWTYNYFPLGELKTQTDAKGQTATFTYDELSRPLTRVIPEATGSLTSTFTWGSSSAAKNIGQLEWMEIAGTGVTTYRETYAYDGYGRPSQVTYTEGPTNHFFNYSYHANTGLLQQITYPTSTDGFRFPIRYDYQYGLPYRVWNNANNNQFWIANAADARGNVTSATLGEVTNGVTFQTLSSFDPVNGRLESRQSTFNSGTVSGTVIENLGFLYDKIGNLIQRQDNRQGLTENFYYDTLDRLSYSTLGATTTNYGYDARGNLTSKTGVGTNYSYTAPVAGCTYYSHPQTHAVRQITGGASTMNFCYDANGNMTNRNGTTISWFANNLPKAVTKDANNSSTFEYGPDGRRWRHVYRTGGSNYTTTYIGNLVEKVVGPTTTDWKHYVYVNGEAISVYIRRTNGAKDRYFFTKDHLGSIAAITHSDGTSGLLRESFHAFGERRGTNWTGIPSTTDLNTMNSRTRRGFTMHEHLDSTGLIHMNGRVYEPNIARFISADPFVQDPFNAQNLNRYSYVLNNPLSQIDADGYCIDGCTFTAVIGTAIQTLASGLLGGLFGKKRRGPPDTNCPAGCRESPAERRLDSENQRERPPTIPLPEQPPTAAPVPAPAPIGPAAGVEAGGGPAAVWGAIRDWWTTPVTEPVTRYVHLPYGGVLYSPDGREISWQEPYTRGEVVGTAAAVTGAAGTLPRVMGSVSRVTTVADRAAQVHRVLDPIAQTQRTTAVLETTGGRIVAGGARDLTPAQRAVLTTDEVAGKLPGAHAEVTAVNTAERIGVKPVEMAVTRPICSECAKVIEASGGRLTSPNTAAWPR